MEFHQIEAAPPRNYNSPCIDCQKPCRGERCRRCKSIHDAGPLPRCLGCDTEVARRLKYCDGCRPAGRSRKKLGRSDVKPQNYTSCIGCGRLVRKYREGKQRCRTCANKDPSRRAKASASMTFKAHHDPVYREKNKRSIQNALRAMHRPENKALAVLGQTVGGGHARRVQRMIAWCPEEYRNFYQRLMNGYRRDPETGKTRHWYAHEARARIERMFGGPLRPLRITTDDVSKSQCWVCGERVHLSPVQLTILLHLIGKHPDHYVTVDDLISLIWPNPNTQPDGGSDTVRAHMWHLRRKNICIINVQGLGYRIAPQVR